MSSRPSTDHPQPALSASAGGLFGTLWRLRLWIVLPAALAAGAAALWLSAVTPLYRSTAGILIEAQTGGLDDREAARSQIQLITSQEFGRQVARSLDLGAHPEFAPDASSTVQRLLARLGALRDAGRRSVEEQVLDRYNERLSVAPGERARVISIDFVSQNPALAARVANTVAERYVEMQRGGGREAASTWSTGEIETLRGRAEDAERRLEDYRRNAGLFAGQAPRASPASLADQELSELTSQLAVVRSDKSAARARARLIRQMLDSGAPLEASEILNSPLIQRLSEQQVRARAQLAELSSTYGPMHPRIRGLNAELADLRQQSREEAERIARSLETDAELAAHKEAELLEALAPLKAQAGEAGAQALELRALEREAQAQREVLETILAQSNGAAGMVSANPRIIARATPASEPFYPQPLPVMLGAVLAAALLGAGLAVALELRQRDAGPGVRVPRSVAAPAGSLAAQVDIAEQPVPRAAKAERATQGANAGLDTIARAIAERFDGGRGRVVLATSARRMPEAAELALRLARLVSARGRRVVLLDTRFNETLPALGGQAPAGSLAELIAGRCAFESALSRDPGSRVHVIPAGQTKANPLALVSSDRMETILRALTQTYEIVVVLGPHLSRRAELRVAGNWAELAVLAGRRGQSDAAAALAHQRLTEIGIDEIAVVTIGSAPTAEPDLMERAA